MKNFVNVNDSGEQQQQQKQQDNSFSEAFNFLLKTFFTSPLPSSLGLNFMFQEY